MIRFPYLLVSVIFILISFGQILAQAPDNDNCSSAQTIPVGFTTQWVFSTLEGALPSTGTTIIDTAACGFGIGNNVRDVWFSFQPTRRRVKVKFKSINGNFTYQVYSGNCNGLTQVKCKTYGNSLANKLDSIIAGPIPLDQTCYIRVYRFSAAPIGISPFQISVENLDIPNILRSKVPGGLWSQASTWEAGIVPVANDSVQISENSVVDMDVTFSTKKPLDWIRIGGEDSTKVARLRTSHILTRSSILIGKKDTVYGKPQFSPTKKTIWLLTPGDILVEGAIKSDELALEFAGKGNIKQRFYGPGAVLIKSCNGFNVENPGGVDIHFPLSIYNTMALLRGELSFYKPSRFYLGRFNFLGDTNTQEITRYLGKISGDFGYILNNNFANGVNEKLNLTYGLSGLIEADEPQLSNLIDTSRDFGKEFYELRSDKINLNISLKRFQGFKETTGNQTLWGMKSGLSKIKCLGPNDTLFARALGSSSVNNNKDSGFENGTICYLGQSAILRIDSSIVGQSQHLLRNSKEMMGGICGVNSINIPANQKVCYQILPQNPSGVFPSAVTALQGKAVFHISSNLPLAAGLFRVGLYVADQDSMLGNPFDYRICQGQSPNGPWKVVSDSVQADYYVNTLKARVSKPLNWSDGSYFCWATSAKNFDASLEELIPPPSYSVGCGSETYKKVGLVIKNHGVQNITGSFSVGYQFEDQLPRNYQVTLPLGQSVKPLKTDTIYLESLFGLQLPDHKMWPYKAWIHLPGDARPENDTLRRNVNYKPRPLPYIQTFDTIPTVIPIGPLFGFYAPNLPYRWFDSLRYQMILDRNQSATNFFKIGGFTSGNKGIQSERTYLGKEVLYTEPIGPLVSPSYWKFQYILSTVPIGDSVYLRSKDTVSFEASTDCGQTWDRLWVQHKNDQYAGSLPQWYGDSLPYPLGTVLVFRWVENFQTFRPQPQRMPKMTFDSVIIKAGLYTEVAPPIENRKEMIRLYPNPGLGSFRMMGPENWLSQELELSVFDLMGRSVWSEKRKFQNEEIQLPGSVKAGLYMIRIRKDNKMISVPYLVDPGR